MVIVYVVYLFCVSSFCLLYMFYNTLNVMSDSSFSSSFMSHPICVSCISNFTSGNFVFLNCMLDITIFFTSSIEY